MPVTTVPAPRAANARSIQRRGRPRSSAAGTVVNKSSSAPRNSSRPSLAGASVATTGTPSRNVSATRSSTSRRANSTKSGAATADLVRATTPCPTPSNSRIRRCSSDCGFHPSVAATTNKQASTAPTPASMFLIKRTCPGTSTSDSTAPEGRVVDPNPKSMVNPRAFSSANRSGSVPVSASTSVDLPWSTWPAVATTCIEAPVPLSPAGRSPWRLAGHRQGARSAGRPPWSPPLPGQ